MPRKVSRGKHGVCPRIKECKRPITRLHFSTFCLGGNWKKCHWYNKWARTLKRPLVHLQKMAISQAQKAEQLAEKDN
ncbi:hypothetical protein GF326_04065 [Candidatus Bathyarchaeota archaeon]|nr:hypothetical protein [Candidatus Bathyarchaeota archaeon]